MTDGQDDPKNGKPNPADDAAEDSSKTDYEVGYQKPPKEHQFKPGMSGNKKGRPKRLPTVGEYVQAVLSRKVPGQGGGKSKTVLEVMVNATVGKAVKADLKAFDMLLTILSAHRDREAESLDQGNIQEDDRAIIEAFRGNSDTGESAPATAANVFQSSPGSAGDDSPKSRIEPTDTAYPKSNIDEISCDDAMRAAPASAPSAIHPLPVENAPSALRPNPLSPQVTIAHEALASSPIVPPNPPLPAPPIPPLPPIEGPVAPVARVYAPTTLRGHGLGPGPASPASTGLSSAPTSNEGAHSTGRPEKSDEQ